jgi:hypothetical protein
MKSISCGEPPFGFIKGGLPAYCEKIKGEGNPNAGNFLWTNGIVEVRSKECPGEEFMKGKLRDYYSPHISLFD